jgi:hypothetical protein
MSESQNDEKIFIDGWNAFLEQFQPYDEYSKMVLEILFKVLLKDKINHQD